MTLAPPACNAMTVVLFISDSFHFTNITHYFMTLLCLQYVMKFTSEVICMVCYTTCLSKVGYYIYTSTFKLCVFQKCCHILYAVNVSVFNVGSAAN